jgi:integrase
MDSIEKNEAGEVIAFRTKKFGVKVLRQAYTYQGTIRWASRFHYAKMVNGELARFPLSANPAESERTADQIAAYFELPESTIAEAKRRFHPKALLRSSNFSTIGELFDFHEEHRKVLELGEKTASGYRSALLVVLRQVDAWRRNAEFQTWSGRHNIEQLIAPWLEKSLSILTARVVIDYKKLMVPSDIEDEEEELTQKISCDTNIRNARSLFSKEALKLYRQSETLAIPDLSEFLSVGLFNAKKYFVLQPVTVIKKLFVAAPELKASDLNAYRAFLACAQIGLRKSEAASFRMEWLQEEDTPVVLVHADGKFKPKHGHGRKVCIDPWVAEELRALSAGGKYFIDGTDTERTDTVFERLNAWLRGQGVDATKPTHELRKLWFSQKSKRHGIEAAAEQGGHRDPKITMSFYSSSLMPDNVLPFWQEPTIAALAKVIKTA